MAKGNGPEYSLAEPGVKAVSRDYLGVSEFDLSQPEQNQVSDKTTDEEREAMRQWIEERFDPAKEYYKNHEFGWPIQELSNCLLEGNHWVSINAYTKELVRHKPDPKGRIRPRTANLYRMYCDQLAATVLEDRVLPWPMGDESGGPQGVLNRQISDVARKALLHIDNINEGELGDLRAAYMLAAEGWVWAKVYWDATMEAEERVFNEATQEAQVQKRAIGDVRIEYFNTRNVIACHTAAEARTIPWLIHAYSIPLSEARRLWPDRARFVIPGKWQYNSLAYMKAAWIVEPVAGKDDKPTAPVDVFECWEREITPEGERWSKFVFCEGVAMEPLTKTEEDGQPLYFPWRAGYCVKSNRREIVGITPLWDLIPLQREVTQTLTSFSYNRELAQYKKWIAKKGSIAEADMHNGPGVIWVDTNTDLKSDAPIIMDTPIDSVGLRDYIQTISTIMSDVINVHPTTRGIVDPSVQSGRHAQISVSQDKGALIRVALEWEAFKKAIFEKCLELIDRHYKPGRVITAVGKDMKLQVEQFERGFANSVSKIHMRKSSRVPLAPQARQEMMMNLAQMGLFQPGREDELRKFFEFQAWPFMEDELNEVRQAQAQQSKENELMAKGKESPAVAKYENHAVHLSGLRTWFNSPQFKELPPAVQEQAQNHGEQHEVFIQEEMAQAAMSNAAPMAAPQSA